jgi:hypothetical protein
MPVLARTEELWRRTMVTEEAVGGHRQKGNVTWPGPRPVVCTDAQSGTGEGVSRSWGRFYLLIAALADCVCAIAGVLLAAHVGFGAYDQLPATYGFLVVCIPAFWCGCVLLAGGYDVRVIGLGSDEFRRVINAAARVAAAIIIASYVMHLDLSRSYPAIAIPVAAMTDLTCRYLLRKQLHGLRGRGRCSQRVVAVGHGTAGAELVVENWSFAPDLQILWKTSSAVVRGFGAY